MTDTYGPLSGTQLELFGQEERSLKMSEGTCRWDSKKSSWILPTSGSMQNGVLSKQAILEPLIGETGCSSLPTPTARDHKEQTLGWIWERDGVIQQDTVPRAITALLPTPAVNDMGAGKDTVAFEEWRMNQKSAAGKKAVHGRSLWQESVKGETNWDRYSPAIERWESVIGTEAPEPSVPHGERRRINPKFVEWMMGLPDGHVTGHELSSAKELKLLGNGVVPQQARQAVKQLLARIDRNENQQLEGGG